MNFIIRLLLPRRLRSALRRPWTLIGILFLCSGWVRGQLFGDMGGSFVEWLARLIATQFQPEDTGEWLFEWVYEFSHFVIIFCLTFCVVLVVARVIVDFPAFTKAIFWAVTRAYEHNLSKFETLILMSLPCSMALTILADGMTSLAAFVLTLAALWFHHGSYNFSRLKVRTDDVMKRRGDMNFYSPRDLESRHM